MLLESPCDPNPCSNGGTCSLTYDELDPYQARVIFNLRKKTFFLYKSLIFDTLRFTVFKLKISYIQVYL